MMKIEKPFGLHCLYESIPALQELGITSTESYS